MAEDWRQAGFALYVHWPFCEAKCPYCDFNSHVARSIDQARWARALASEVRRVARETPGRVLNSVFFGGGTPSLMDPESVAAVLEASRENWVWANDIEVTLEANPRSVEAARFDGYARAGVNRVSLGVQALRDDELRRLGRLHGVDEAKRAFGVARSVFDRVSFDLIYARQDQSLTAWEAELREALDMAVDHLSLYQLTIEQGTAFWDRQRAGGLRGLPDEDLAADMYDLTNEICAEADMQAYEVSNHARPGAESRHNLIYWRYGDWVGVGPGAHGRLTLDGTRWASECPAAPGAWLSRVENTGQAEDRTALSPQDIVNERIMMGLRLTEGVDMEFFEAQPILNMRAASLVEDGLMWCRDGRAGATVAGRLLLNRVIGELLVD
ncbi:radical SAM family heme chaperone HemW [Thetidibacter halocola]|uniref:Heme chaperone HemW n=1 Tax=Thetidibacter halocola TaxID=2827239 RepID=A0A8J8B600_9RHOB|nr:radical SAM family heme chaperone HemW [Thetidibacter halocola]MBS0123466.1 coproporphyrinogen III oxidase [Thetidibacter halocola]